jgi:hypothetical protein
VVRYRKVPPAAAASQIAERARIPPAYECILPYNLGLLVNLLKVKK